MAVLGPIADIGKFFDRLVDLIPPKHYFDAGEAINLKYLKRAERDVAKASFKEQHKQSKRARLDPDAAQTTTQLQHERHTVDAEPSTSQAAEPPHLRANLSSSASREELQKRLQAKVEALRQQRKVADQLKSAASAKEWRQAQLKGKEKRKGAKRPAKAAPDAEQPAKVPRTHAPPATEAAEQPPSFVFNHLRVTDGAGEKAGKGGKHKAKQQLLREAEARQAAAEELSKTSEGKAKLKEETWKKMMKLAQGEKILDNPQLLRRSIKKEGKLKAKKQEAWAGRVDSIKEKQAKVQQRRHDNLQKRVDEKKAKKVAKREKKLLRAGFEGRKDTFIT